MAESCDTKISGCLFYTANSLARFLNEMADEAFKELGIAPAYAYVMIVILEEPGLTQRRIGDRMNLKPSTVTRFINKLVDQGLVERLQEGRNVRIFPTESGLKKKSIIEQGLKVLHDLYSDKLGEDYARKLTVHINEANVILRE